MFPNILLPILPLIDNQSNRFSIKVIFFRNELKPLEAMQIKYNEYELEDQSSSVFKNNSFIEAM